jgi:hypothetical protein
MAIIMRFTRGGIVLECRECSARFLSHSPELEAGHDCEVKD